MSIGTEPYVRPRPKGKVAERHEAEYRRVVLALYVSSYDARGWTQVRDKALGEFCGLSPATVKRALNEMYRRKIIDIFDWGNGRHWRTIVFLDHPRASEVIAEIKSERY